MSIIETEYRKLVRSIGGGFHPDTRGDDYVTLPDGVDAERLDEIVEDAFAADLDVYGIALDELNSDA